jgi:transposase
MLHVAFTEAEKSALHYERYHHPHPCVQRKMEALWLKSQGFRHKDICRVVGITGATLTTYLRSYEEGGIEALKVLSFNKPRSALDDHRGTLEEYFRKNPPASVGHAMSEIERLTGLKRNKERIRQFLKRIGMKCRKVGMVPAKADVEKQAEFKKKSWSRV